jgi:hypothetical protein
MGEMAALFSAEHIHTSSFYDVPPLKSTALFTVFYCYLQNSNEKFRFLVTIFTYRPDTRLGLLFIYKG